MQLKIIKDGKIIFDTTVNSCFRIPEVGTIIKVSTTGGLLVVTKIDHDEQSGLTITVRNE